jgi:putative transposase
MRFAFVEEHRNEMPVNRLCEIMDVSPRGRSTWHVKI